MPEEVLFSPSGPREDPRTGMVMMPVSADLIRNNRDMLTTSTAWLRYLKAELKAEKGVDEGEVADAIEEIRSDQLRYAEKLEAEGRLDEAIELLGLSPSDAAALMKQISDVDKEADLAAIEKQKIADNRERTNVQNTLIAGSVIFAALFYLYKRRLS